MIADSLIALLGFKFEGADDARQWNATLKNAEQKLQAFSDRVTTIGRAIALGMGAAVGGAGIALGKNVMSLSAEWEKYTATLETIEGSKEKAEASLDWVSDFAKRTPYDLAQVTEAFIKMRAYGLDPTDGSLSALGDAGSAMGKDLMSAVEAMADAVNGEQERLKEFGLTSSTVGDQVTYSWNKNGQSFSKTIRKNGAEISKFIKEHMQANFGGAMLRQSKTWDGMWSNMLDSWDDFQRRIGRTGFFESMKRGLGDVLDKIDELDRNGTLDLWATRLGFAFEWVVEKAKGFAVRIGGHVETIMGMFNGKFGNIGENLKPILTVLGFVLARLFPVTAAFVALNLALEDWLTYMAGGKSVIGDLVQALADFLGADPDKVATALGEIAKATAWFGAAAIGIGMFTGALGRLAGVLTIMKGMRWATAFLAGLANVQWGAAIAGAGASAAGAGAVAGGGAAAAAGRAGGSAVAAAGVARAAGGPGAVLAGGLAGIYLVDKILSAINERIKEIGTDPQWAKDRLAPVANNGIGQSGHYSLAGSGAADFSAYEARMQGGGGDGTQAGINVMKSLYENAKSWWDSASAAASAASLAATINDSRDQSVTNNVSAPVTVNVQQASQAPAAVGRAISDAIPSTAVPPTRTIDLGNR
ncbi:tape measure protein [Aureimonas flava]|uniref:tape measure protein n=1 Tax=Aureimonas flava TaxID=2320271 RepID=UPI001459FD4E|nr:tape measure protein [Aureimonas flava]